MQVHLYAHVVPQGMGVKTSFPRSWAMSQRACIAVPWWTNCTGMFCYEWLCQTWRQIILKNKEWCSDILWF